MRPQATVRKRKLNRKLNRKKTKKIKGGDPNSFAELEKNDLNLFKYGTFKNAISMKPIIQNSKNGFIYDIEYEIQEPLQIKHAILKSSLLKYADNLFYEYLVGIYINKLTKRYPCFIETYSLEKYNAGKYTNFQETRKYDVVSKFEPENNFLINSLSQITLSDDKNIDQAYSDACSEPTHFSILIQYLSNILNIGDILEIKAEGGLLTFYNTIFDLMHILFQIYIPLAKLKDNFTHNDLHAGNVALYQLYGDNEYIQYNYKFGEKIVSFKSRYMVKIIDYGRSYFRESPENNSVTIYDKICKTISCSNCGYSSGFSKNVKNISTDLLFFQIIKDHIKNIKTLPGLHSIDKNDYKKYNGRVTHKYINKLYKSCLENLKSMVKKLEFKDKPTNSTPEILNSKRDKSGKVNKINNVQDAADIIMEFVTQPEYKEINDFLYDSTQKRKVTLNIDMDGEKDMTYEMAGDKDVTNEFNK